MAALAAHRPHTDFRRYINTPPTLLFVQQHRGHHNIKSRAPIAEALRHLKRITVIVQAVTSHIDIPPEPPPMVSSLEPLTRTAESATISLTDEPMANRAATQDSTKMAGTIKKAPTAQTESKKVTTHALDTIRERNSKKPLMRLPGELRNKIYILAIEDELVAAKSQIKAPFDSNIDVTVVFEQLLRAPEFINTCYKMRTECSGLFNPKTVEMYDSSVGQYAAQPISALQLRSELSICRRITAYEHVSALEAKEKWQDFLEAARRHMVVGVVTWDSSLGVKTMWFAGDNVSYF